MWKLHLAFLLVASASALRGRSLAGFDGDPHKDAGDHHKHPPDHHKHHATDHNKHHPGRHKHAEESHKQKSLMPTVPPAPAYVCANATAETRHATCGPFPGRRVVLVTVSVDFIAFFKNWLHYAGPFLSSSEQVLAFAEDEEVVPMLRRFLHQGATTPFKIAIPANEEQTAWNLTTAADRTYSQDVYEIRIQDIHPFGSNAYKEIVSQRPRQIRYFLEQGCSVLYADIDTAWLENPFRAIQRAGKFEMYVTDDSKHNKGLQSTYLCSCFLYVHPTSNAKAVMSRWEFLLEGKLQNNQGRFNQAFRDITRCFPDFDAVALPQKEFPPGCVRSSHPTVLHANYIKGEKKKKAFLEKHGAWSLD